MTELRAHQGIRYSIPNNDYGVWHHNIHLHPLKTNMGGPRSGEFGGYETRAEAMTAADLAIEDWMHSQLL